VLPATLRATGTLAYAWHMHACGILQATWRRPHLTLTTAPPTPPTHLPRPPQKSGGPSGSGSGQTGRCYPCQQSNRCAGWSCMLQAGGRRAAGRGRDGGQVQLVQLGRAGVRLPGLHGRVQDPFASANAAIVLWAGGNGSGPCSAHPRLLWSLHACCAARHTCSVADMFEPPSITNGALQRRHWRCLREAGCQCRQCRQCSAGRRLPLPASSCCDPPLLQVSGGARWE